MDNNQIKHDILNFKLNDCAEGNQRYNRVLLQLFGFAGHGKSCFINSCKFVLDGEYRVVAEAGEKEGGLTMERRSFQLTETITMVDNRGFGIMSGFQTLEVYAQLGNFLPLNEKVEWKNGFHDLMAMIEDADISPNFTDFIVPIFVYSVQHRLHKLEEIEMKRFLENCLKMTGIFPIIVLTKKTSGDYFEVKKMFKLFGAEVVYTVENYRQDNHQETRGRHEDILNILGNAVKEVTFRMERKRNPNQDRIEHKKFILQMAHEIALAKELEEKRALVPDGRTWFRKLWDNLFAKA